MVDYLIEVRCCRAGAKPSSSSELIARLALRAAPSTKRPAPPTIPPTVDAASRVEIDAVPYGRRGAPGREGGEQCSGRLFKYYFAKSRWLQAPNESSIGFAPRPAHSLSLDSPPVRSTRRVSARSRGGDFAPLGGAHLCLGTARPLEPRERHRANHLSTSCPPVSASTAIFHRNRNKRLRSRSSQAAEQKRSLRWRSLAGRREPDSRHACLDVRDRTMVFAVIQPLPEFIRKRPWPWTRRGGAARRAADLRRTINTTSGPRWPSVDKHETRDVAADPAAHEHGRQAGAEQDERPQAPARRRVSREA